jgi:hypothetical protein
MLSVLGEAPWTWLSTDPNKSMVMVAVAMVANVPTLKSLKTGKAREYFVMKGSLF